MSARDAVAQTLKENEHVIFNGHGYTDEWKEEAAKRGLPNLENTPAALAQFNSEKNKALCARFNVRVRGCLLCGAGRSALTLSPAL